MSAVTQDPETGRDWHREDSRHEVQVTRLRVSSVYTSGDLELSCRVG